MSILHQHSTNILYIMDQRILTSMFDVTYIIIIIVILKVTNTDLMF